MKKLFLILTLVLLPIVLIGQTKLYKGVEIGKGGNVVTIDSIIQSSTFFKLYHGATELINIDTATMLGHYIERKDTSSMLSKYAHKASPTFTGVPKISTDTVATRAYARTYGGSGIVTIDEVRTEINDSLDVLRPLYAPIADTMAYPAAGIAVSTGTAWTTPITDASTNWNTAYTDRLKWDGGATGLTAAIGRTSLGATTVGSAFFTLTNPSAITFPRIDAANTVTTRSATELKSDLSLGNVTNESKTTMFTSPTFTGTVTIPTPFTLGVVSVTSTGTQLNYFSGTTGTTGTGNLVLSAAPTLTGHPTIEGVTSTGATGTGNLVFSASPTFTGTPILPTPFTIGAISMTATGTQLNYLNAATGTTGTTSTNLVFSTSPALTTPTVVTSIVGDATFAAFNTTTTNLSLGGAATTMTVGGTPTTTITHSYSANATATGSTKTVNLGTGGATGSTTNVNIGATAGGTTTINSPTTALGTGSLTMTGSIAATGSRVTKGWFTDIESTNVPTASGVALSRVYSDTMAVSAGVLRTKATTITTEPYAVQIFSSNGNDITHNVKDSVALNGGVYKLYVYSVDALTGAKIKILY